MEKKLTSSNITLILVTHDRVFMEAVCTGVLELDQGVVHTHAFGGPGSYERFCQVCNRFSFRGIKDFVDLQTFFL